MPVAHRWERSVLAAIAVGLCVASLVATRDGVGVDADSAAYLGAARHVADGHGLTVPFTLFTDEYSPREAAAFEGRVPLTHFPPAYPLAVAAVTATGRSVDDAARIIGAFTLGVNLFLLGLLAALVVPNVVARLVVVVLAAVGPVAGALVAEVPARSWLFQHSQAMSEGLFTTFALASLLALERDRRIRTHASLLHVSALAGLALATRFVGIAVVAVVVIGIGRWGQGARADRWRRAGAAGALAVVPTALWALWMAVVEGAAWPRSLHWPSRGPRELARVFEGWFGMGDWPALPRHLALAVLAAAVLVLARRGRRPVLDALVVLTASYTGAVILTRAMVDASTPTDDRMLSPLQGPFYVLVLGTIGAAVAARVAAGTLPAVVLRAVGLGIPIGLVLAASPDAWRVVDDGVAPRRPVPRVVAATATLPRDALIATNVPTQVWERTGRASILVPLRLSTTTDRPNRSFHDQLRELVAVLETEGGYVLLVDPDVGRYGTVRQANERDFAPFESLRVLRRLDDGVILVAGDGTNIRSRTKRSD